MTVPLTVTTPSRIVGIEPDPGANQPGAASRRATGLILCKCDGDDTYFVMALESLLIESQLSFEILFFLVLPPT